VRDGALAFQRGKAHLVCTMPGRAKSPSTPKRSPPDLDHAEGQLAMEIATNR
jgi:hypothetical protein